MQEEKSWICKVCGYVHKGSEPPETCPVCSVGKENFEAVKPATASSETKSWVCKVCGYIHKGSEPPETCPICGVGPEQFEIVVASDAVQEKTVSEWKCSVCGYIHKGDAPPKTCPVCNVGPELFSPYQTEADQAAAPEKCKIVIIGDGIAGFTAAESARETNPNAEILLLSKEGILPYFRLNLTRLLAGEVKQQDLEMKDNSWFAEQQIQWQAGDVTDILTDEKKVKLSDDSTVSYEKLILANGSHPFIPPFPGVTREGVTALRTIKDAEIILNTISPNSKCVIIGGGLLGLEAACALNEQNVDVFVIEGHGWLLPRQLPESAGNRLIDHLEAKGIHIIRNTRVKNIFGDECVKGVELDNGEILQTNLVIVSTGVRPNSYLARLAGLTTERGVVVNDRMETSDPDIYAAGDVAEHRGIVYGIWPASYTEGAVAGTNAAGGQASFTGLVRSNQLKVSDVDLFSVGKILPEDGSYHVVEKSGKSSYAYLVCRDNRIIGGALYGDISLATAIKDAIENKTQISELTELKEYFPELASIIF